MRTFGSLVLGLVFLLGSVSFASDGAPQKQTQKDVAQKVKKLIQQLGHESFQVREKATEELKKMGKVAVPYLQEALKSKDPEVQWRAKMILQHLQGVSRPKTVQKPRAQGNTPPRPSLRLRIFGPGSEELKKILRRFGLEELWKGLGFPRLRGFGEFDRLFRELERELERSLRGLERELPRLPRGGQQGGVFRIWRWENGKKKEEVWRFRNGRWEKVNPKDLKPSQPSMPKPRLRLLPSPPRVQRQKAYLGIRIRPVPKVLRYHLSLGNKGIMVEQVLPGSRAEKAGLVKYDIILEVNGKVIRTVEELRAALAAEQGKGVTLKVLRQGKEMTLQVPPISPKEKEKEEKPKRKFF